MSGNLPPGVTDAMIDALYDEPPPRCRECDDAGCPACDAELRDAADGYATFRGRCKELSEAACAADPSLTLVRGHYWCPIWNVDEPHWWTVRPDGTIHDPSANQFPSKGMGEYVPFDGIVPCDQCGKEMREDEVKQADGRYAFCSGECYCMFVGVPLTTRGPR